MNNNIIQCPVHRSRSTEFLQSGSLMLCCNTNRIFTALYLRHSIDKIDLTLFLATNSTKKVTFRFLKFNLVSGVYFSYFNYFADLKIKNCKLNPQVLH